MKDQIKQLQSRLESCISFTGELKPNKLYSSFFTSEFRETGQLISGSNSKEIEKAVDSLFLAKCWVEKTLKEFESEEDLDKGFIKFIMDRNTWKSFDHYGKIDCIKSQIRECIDINASIPVRNNRIVLSTGNNTYQHLNEARFWLEAEMDRYYESQKGPRVD